MNRSHLAISVPSFNFSAHDYDLKAKPQLKFELPAEQLKVIEVILLRNYPVCTPHDLIFTLEFWFSHSCRSQFAHQAVIISYLQYCCVEASSTYTLQFLNNCIDFM